MIACVVSVFVLTILPYLLTIDIIQHMRQNYVP